MTPWKRLRHAFKWIAKVCFILCPPAPNLIIRKVAFHPPKHCQYYFLIGGEVSNSLTNSYQMIVKQMNTIDDGIKKRNNAYCKIFNEKASLIMRKITRWYSQ